MRQIKIGKPRKGAKAAAAVFLVLSLALPLAAKEKAKGAEVLVQKKDGQRVRAELLAIKDGRLIMMDAATLSEVTFAVDEIRSIRVVKKAKVWSGLGLGVLTGAIAGSALGFLGGDDDPGWFSLTAGEKALRGGVAFAATGGAVGGVAGALKGIDQSADLEAKSVKDRESFLKKLDKAARFPQGPPPDSPKPGSTPKSEAARAKFSRFHLNYRPGYSFSQAGTKCASLFDEIGFGDFSPGYEVDLFFFSIDYPGTDYPEVAKKRAKTYEDVRVDFSITRNIAIGIAYSRFGESAITGYKRIPINKGGKHLDSKLFLNADYSGRLYYVMVSWTFLPDPAFRKTWFTVGAGAGWNRPNLHYSVSGTSSSAGQDNQNDFNKGAVALLGVAELNYFFNRNLSFGLNVEYRYAPFKVGSFGLTGFYYDLDNNYQLTQSSMLVTLPEHIVDLGGFRLGISIGFHL